MRIERYKGSRFWALYDEAGALVVVTVYKRGAAEVQRRLARSLEHPDETATDTTGPKRQ